MVHATVAIAVARPAMITALGGYLAVTAATRYDSATVKPNNKA